MKHSDEQLDQLLRQVDVPSDLKQRLFQIPQSTEVAFPERKDARAMEKQQTRRRRGRAAWLGWTAAATLIGAGMFWMLSENNDGLSENDNETKIESLEPAKDRMPVESGSLATTPSTLSIEQLLTEMRENNKLIDRVATRMQTRLRQQKLSRHRSLSPPIPPAGEMLAIIECYSSVSQIDWGRAPIDVREDFETVVLEYPGTVGAEHAQGRLADTDF